MKYLTIIYLAFSASLLLFGCQSDDASSIVPISTRSTSVSDNLSIPMVTIPPTEVEEETLDGAQRWIITFYNIDYDKHYQYQRFFSTVDGSFRNITQLMNSPSSTANADLDFLVGRMQNAAGFLSPHPQYVVHTQFKPSDLSAKELDMMAHHNPEQLADAFENSPYMATDKQPYNYVEDDYTFDYYQTGDIFLFKTDRTPARYGAVRIIHSQASYYANSRVVEVIVQTGRSSFVKLKN